MSSKPTANPNTSAPWRTWLWLSILVVTTLIVATKLLADRALRQLTEGLHEQAAQYGWSVTAENWSSDWVGGIVWANNVTISPPNSSIPVVRVPLMGVDFRPFMLSEGWGEAIYQVFLHRPKFRFVRDDQGCWNWERLMSNRSLRAHVAAEIAPPTFRLGRLYADVVEVTIEDADRRLFMDNGVLTITALQMPISDPKNAATLDFHARVNGGKFSVVGGGDLFAWDHTDRGVLWRPRLDAELTAEAVAGQPWLVRAPTSTTSIAITHDGERCQIYRD